LELLLKVHHVHQVLPIFLAIDDLWLYVVEVGLLPLTAQYLCPASKRKRR
jgi:hypothetical protein